MFTLGAIIRPREPRGLVEVATVEQDYLDVVT